MANQGKARNQTIAIVVKEQIHNDWIALYNQFEMHFRFPISK